MHFLSKLFWYYFLCFQIRYYANSSNTLNLKTPEKSQTVPNYSKILILAKLFQILILTKFFRNPYVNLIRNSLILWSSLNYINILPTSSFHLLTYTNPTFLLDAMLQTVILHQSFFTCFVLFKSIIPSYKSNMNNSFWIAINKIIIIKISIIKIYTIKALYHC